MEEKYIPITSYDTALSLNRLSKIFAWATALLIVFTIDYITSAGRLSIFSLVSFLIAGTMIAKCWADMIIKTEPFKNCWAFKED